jgi:hypothetical protein
MSNGRKIADLIVGTNVKVTVVDSDLDNIIGSLKTRLDSDDAKLQSLDTAINQGLVNLADSDLITSQLQAKINSAVANIDSDSTAIQSANTQIAGIVSRLDSDDGRLQALNIALAAEIVATNTDISAVKGRMDSDDGRLQSLDSSITILNTRLDSDSTALSAAKSLIGQAVAGQGMADSDLKVVADLRNQLDSEIEQSKNIIVTYTNIIYRATAGQTTFTGSGINSLTLAYTAGSIQVFLNGVRLEDEDYTATNGTSIVLTVPAQINAELTILVPTLQSNYTTITTVWQNGSHQAKVVHSSASNGHRFGQSAAIHGNYAVVGTPGTSQGEAYVFFRTGSSWAQQAKLVDPSPTTGDDFGIEVAIQGSTIAITSLSDDDGANNSGAIHIFNRSGTSWSHVQKIKQSPATADSKFGEHIHMSGDYLIASCMRLNNPTDKEGAAFIFYYNGSSWSQQAKVEASDKQVDDQFGKSVGMDTDNVIVGAMEEDTGGSNAGSAYIFTRSGTSWTQQAKIQATGTNANDRFGYKAAISGDYAVVSAPGRNSGDGEAIVFKRTGSSWSQHQVLVPSNLVSGDLFAQSVDIQGTTIAVGAQNADFGGVSEAGSVWIWELSGGSWVETKQLGASTPGTQDFFGAEDSVSLDSSSDQIIVGSYKDDDAGSASGSAHIFTA